MTGPRPPPCPALARPECGAEEPPPHQPGPPPREVLVLRYGELFLKKGNRRTFLEAVEHRVRRTVADLGAVVRGVHGRLLVEGVGHSPEALARLRLVFGIASISPAWFLGREPGEWERLAVARAQLARQRGARSFAIDTERPDKQLPFRSQEVNERLGAAVVRRSA